MFENAKRLSNLTLKPSKCNIVPLNLLDPGVQDCSNETVFIEIWLLANIPQWSKFKIALAAKYLGFFLAPNLQIWFGKFRPPNGRFEQGRLRDHTSALCWLQSLITLGPCRCLDILRSSPPLPPASPSLSAPSSTTCCTSPPIHSSTELSSICQE